MSLINQMLKDLEQRKAEGAQTEQLPKQVLIVDEPPSSRSAWGIVATVLLLIAAATGGGWWYFTKLRAPAPEPMPIAAMKPPAEPAPPAPIEAQPAPAAAVPEVAESVPAPPPVPEAPAALIASPPKPSLAPPPVAEVPSPAPPVTAAERPRKRKWASRRPFMVEGEQAIPQRRRGMDADDHYQRALRLQDGGQEREAREELEATLNEAPANDAARRALARNYAASGQYRRADDVLSQIKSPDAETARLRAEIYLKEGHAEQAQQALDEAPADDEDPARLAVQGAIRQRQGRYDEAADYYGKAARSQPSQAKWWLGLAMSLEGNERYQEAAAAYQKVLDAGAPSQDVQRYVEARIERLQGGH